MRHTLYIVLLLPLLLLTSCRDADDKLPGDGSTKLVTVSRLSVSIEGIQSADEETTTTTRSAETRSARTAETRSADADGIDAKGYLGSEKKKFVEGDVLHFAVALTENDLYSGNYQVSNATLQKDGTTWLFDKPLILPQDATKTRMIEVFYDGKQDKYNCYDDNGEKDAALDNYQAAYWDALIGTKDAQSGYTFFPDMLVAKKDDYGQGWNSNGISLISDGTLKIMLKHLNPLVRISSITNRLDKDVKTIKANALMVNGSDIFHYDVLLSGPTSSASNAAAYDAIIGEPDVSLLDYYLKSFTVTFTDGHTAVIPVPNNYGGYDYNGRKLTYATGSSFTYRLLLLPGSLSAVPDENGTAFKKRRDPAVPAGYIPIYTADDLRKIGTNQPAVVNGYLYTNASSAILANEAMTDPIYNSQYSAYTDSGCSTDGAGGGTIDITSDGSTEVGPLFFSLSARYILMNDIDLTPASGAIGTDLVGIESVPKEELWTPIRYESNTGFSGRFNGNGFTIRGMTICSDAVSCGLFKSTIGAVIYNLHMQDARVKNTHTTLSSPNTGSLVGESLNSTFSLCSANGCALQSGQNDSNVGGLVGYNYDSTLTRCHAAACTLFSEQSLYAGGLVGYNRGILASCYTAGCTSIISQYIGGLAGSNSRSIYGCYATYSQAPSRVFGSLVGLNNGAIASCYAINAPNSNNPGLVDNNNKTITACVSPFKTPGDNQDGSHNGAPGYDDNIDGQDNGGGSYWNVISTPGANGTTTYTGGYAPLTDATALATLSGYIDINGKSPFTDKGNLAAVRTILVNDTGQDLIGIDVGGGEYSNGSIFGALGKIPPGGLYVLKREWTALGIWGGSTAPTSDKNPTASLPRIKWEYEGEKK